MGSKRASRSRSWSARQNRDPYVKKARESDYRSRAAFKLQQLDQKERLIRAGMLVVDLGAAPGSWSQYAAAKVGSTGVVVAVDRLDMGDIQRFLLHFSRMPHVDKRIVRLDLRDSLDFGRRKVNSKACVIVGLC